MERYDINRHRRIIAYIFLVLGLLSLAFGIISINAFYLFEEWMQPDLPDAFNLGFLTIHNPVHWLIVFPYINLVAALLKISAAIGIFNDQKWAHKLALVIAFFWFFKFPLGTAFSFYILYAFLNRKTVESTQILDTKEDVQKD